MSDWLKTGFIGAVGSASSLGAWLASHGSLLITAVPAIASTALIGLRYYRELRSTRCTVSQCPRRRIQD